MLTNVYKPKKNREIILQRRENVKRLFFVEHRTIRYIARVLNWDYQTIFRDINKIRESFKGQISMANAKAVLRDVMETRIIVLQRLWEEIDDETVKPIARIKGLKAIDDIKERNIRDLQELGFIPKPTQPIEVDQKAPPTNVKIILEEYGKHKSKRCSDLKTKTSNKTSK